MLAMAQALGDVLKRWAHDGLLPLLPDLLMHTTKRWPLVAVATSSTAVRAALRYLPQSALPHRA